MFVKNCRFDTMIGGQAQTVILYPKISDEDWQKWKAFLPLKSVVFCKQELLYKTKIFFEKSYSIPSDVRQEMVRGARHFQEIEIWASARYGNIPLPWVLTEMGSAI